MMLLPCNELESINNIASNERNKSNVNIEKIEEFLNSSFEDQYSKLTTLEKRRFWRGILKEITWDKEKHIDFTFL